MNTGMDIKEVALTKKLLRSKILLRLKRQKEEDRSQKIKAIGSKLLKTIEFKKAKIVMFYIALRGEVNTDQMIKAAKQLGKIVAVPVCISDRISIKPCILDGHGVMRKGPYGVVEPAVKRPVRLRELDLIIVPGLAFDKKGNRLGRGKGYYDRFLGKLFKDTPSIGLAYDFQILPFVPTASHDVSVTHVISA
ncbi:MAG: 5-formyltetrahydrofolate cyclo-ligase [Candidatus Omnitrophica bacterium]|nr:5-formyltetrahydrofolate cyclo-ligase [Candidatus Omnitrophota bacterium]